MTEKPPARVIDIIAINRKICQALGLDVSRMYELTLHCSAKGQRLEVRYFVHDEEGQALADVLRHYMLVEAS